MRIRVKRKKLDEIRLHCLAGLKADGEASKQWYLNNILRYLCRILEEDYEAVKTFYGFDEGALP